MPPVLAACPQELVMPLVHSDKPYSVGEGENRVSVVVIGQQMVSLTAMEVTLTDSGDDFPGIAICAIGKDGELRPTPLFVANIANAEALIEALQIATARSVAKAAT
jgi:hypothetical protein